MKHYTLSIKILQELDKPIFSLLLIVSVIIYTSCGGIKDSQKYIKQHDLGNWKKEYNQSIYHTIKHTPKKTRKVYYYYNTKNELEYIEVKLKMTCGYMRIYPNYSNQAPIMKPSRGNKIKPSELKSHVPSRISFYLNTDFIECASMDYYYLD